MSRSFHAARNGSSSSRVRSTRNGAILDQRQTTIKGNMKLSASLFLAAMALCALGSSGHECKVECDAADKTPVCGSDGKTYSSTCFLEFAKCDKPSLKLAHEHECDGYSAKHLHITITKSKNEKVDDREDEDSDSDSETDVDVDEDDEEKKNRTELKVKVNVKNEQCEKDCTRELEQVCASDGNTYDNNCLFENARCKNKSLSLVDKDGACPDDKKDKCDKGCSRELIPVCGSNGKTYSNKCLFEIAKCKDPSLTLAKAVGRCEEKDECDRGCSRELDEICASDGKTYNNHCLFEIAHCRNKSLKIVNRDGPCPEK